MAEHIEKGKKSEEEAAEWLVNQGYEIVCTNFRYNKKEIDIITRKDDLLVFVEVKTRLSARFGLPEEPCGRA